MAHSNLPAEAIAQITETVGVLESAAVFINGEAARLAVVREQALDNGATSEELAPLTDHIATLKAKSAEVAAAIAANPSPV